MSTKYPIPESLLEAFKVEHAVVTLDVNFMRGNQASMIRRMFWYDGRWHVQARFRRWVDIYHGDNLDDAVKVLMAGAKAIEPKEAEEK